ncbi:MAG: DNA polymerase I [Deltaproteobacteria bacterium]|nr:DNA polymerase I [Deltaproteobacteria bacterium]MBW2135975.1 DNA polymerase I [Deltaproteobacteria bacterium]
MGKERAPREKTEDTVYLVDGSNYIHRAYHAIRNLSTSKGFPTNAVFGFCKMLLRLLEDRRPVYLAIAYDSKGPTFRHDLYEEYKATRPPMPEDLSVQLPYIRAIVEALEVKGLERESYEADDIMGTLARMCEEKGFRVVIVTGDKDMKQVITARTSLWDTMRDVFTDYDTFVEKYGVSPSQFIDIMGLAGDSSDNIPGVPGIGEKTALSLIRKYGTVEGVYSHLDEIGRAKLRENLIRFKDNAVLSKKLATIDRHVPIEGDVEQLRLGEPRGDELARIFRELEFKGLWYQFAPLKDEKGTEYVLCLTEGHILGLKDRIKDARAVSVNTVAVGKGPLRADLVGLSLCLEKEKAYYVPFQHARIETPEQLETETALGLLRDGLEDEGVAKIGHDLKSHALLLRCHGVRVKGFHFDTMIGSYVINPSRGQHDLENLAQQFLNQRLVDYQGGSPKGNRKVDPRDAPLETTMGMACDRAAITFQLADIMDGELRSEGNDELFYELEMKLLPVLLEMEWNGIKIDREYFQEMSRRFSQELKSIEREIYEEVGMEFNINSSQQLAFVLFEKLGLPVKKKTVKRKAYSTDVNVLKGLSTSPYKTPKLLLRYRTLSKLKSTYLDSLVELVHPRTGRIHTSFNQAVTATGRLSSSNPNLQNIPVRGEEGRRIRRGFVCESGHRLLCADYSQIELRIFAHYSKDPAFVEAFRTGQDIHTRTASEITGVGEKDVTPEMRGVAKAINFGIIYGMGARRLADELGIDYRSARDYIDRYYERHRGVSEYREAVMKEAKEKGYVSTLFKRKRYLPHINHGQHRIRSEAERMAINTPIQGTAADLIKKAMVGIHHRLLEENFKTKMLLQVHDELLFEVPDAEIEAVVSMVREEMEGVTSLDVPLKVDIKTGKNWDEAH